MGEGWNYYRINGHNNYLRWWKNIISIGWLQGNKFKILCVSAYKSNLVAKKIELIEAIYDLSIDLHGPTCELLEVHNSTNATQVFLCLANLLS
jgi:hypothetical protein